MALSFEKYAAMQSYSRVLSMALDEKDAATRRHCEHVIELSEELGRHCRLPSADLRHLWLAAALHDIGKIGIRDAVLLKPGRFDPDERREMQSHAERGQRIVAAIEIEGAHEVALAVRHHHEDFDGDGYPDGLCGEAIPVIARMVALADAYDAMAEPRRYQSRRSHREIMDVLADESGARFDPWLLARFGEMIRSSARRVA